MTARSAAADSSPAPNGQALIVALAAATAPLVEELDRIGYRASVVSDPYAAAVELVRRPLAFRAVVLSLTALYPPELRLIELIRGRYGHIEVILADTSGRPEALEEAKRLGAHAILNESRLKRLDSSTDVRDPRTLPAATAGVLSADEIRALLG